MAHKVAALSQQVAHHYLPLWKSVECFFFFFFQMAYCYRKITGACLVCMGSQSNSFSEAVRRNRLIIGVAGVLLEFKGVLGETSQKSLQPVFLTIHLAPSNNVKCMQNSKCSATTALIAENKRKVTEISWVLEPFKLGSKRSKKWR